MMDSKKFDVRYPCAIVILSLAPVSFGAPAHACRHHGEFAMQRYNPFQAEPYDNSSSRSARSGQVRRMTPIARDPDKEALDGALSNRPQVDEQPQNLQLDLSSNPAADRIIPR